MSRLHPVTGHPWDTLQRSLAIAAAALAGVVSRRLGHAGTSLPGLVAERIRPSILAEVGAGRRPVVMVLGTNGKTTTTHLVSTILEHARGPVPVTNRSGANLRQAVLTTLLESGHPKHDDRPVVLEVDEMAFEAVSAAVRPAVVVMLNLLRDQLDRYGEIDAIEERLLRNLSALDPATVLVACADDPRLERLARGSGLVVRTFGLRRSASAAGGARDPLDAARPDAARCPHCGGTLVFAVQFAPGLGDWRCPRCGAAREEPDLSVALAPAPGNGVRLDVRTRRGVDRTLGREHGPGLPAGSASAVEPESASTTLHLTGTGAAYDTGAALLVATVLGIGLADAAAAVNGAGAAYGRLEELLVDDRLAVLTLMKNPASFSQAVEAVRDRDPDALLVGLGDRPADGRDVSWIWDVRFDQLAAARSVVLTGSRAHDLALRFKYGDEDRPGAPDRREKADTTEVVVPVAGALARALERTPPGGTLMVVATYTVLLGLRRALERRGVVGAPPR